MKSSLVALCLCVALVCRGVAASGGASGGAFEEYVKLVDVNQDDMLSLSELTSLRKLTLKGDAKGTECANITAMLEHAEVAIAIGSAGIPTSGPGAARVMAELLSCAYASFANSVSISMGDEEFECHGEPEEHDEHEEEEEHGEHEGEDEDDHADHDEDEHDDHDEETLTVALAGGANLTCYALHVEEELVFTVTGQTWLLSLGAVTIVSLASLVGVSTLVCRNSSLLDTRQSVDLATDVTAAAVGVLVGTVFIHLLPEATGMVGDAGNLSIGLGVIGGVFTAMIFEVAFHHSGSHEHDVVEAIEHNELVEAHLDAAMRGVSPGGSVSSDSITEPNYTKASGNAVVEIDSGEVTGMGREAHPTHHNHNHHHMNKKGSSSDSGRTDKALVANILWGDALHNFTDGILIASTFATCSPTLGWLVLASIILHELPQEYLDFIIMVRAGMPVSRALAFNFLSACTSYVGAILVLASESALSFAARGYLILYGTGVLVYIALVELAPRILMDHNATKTRKIVRLGLILFGIGLVSLLGLFNQDGCAHGGHAGH